MLKAHSLCKGNEVVRATHNLANVTKKRDFRDVYSNDTATLDSIISELENVWEFRFANGRMKRNQ